MWPKVLFDLAPHLVKLVPAANRFLQDRSTTDEANRKAMDELAAGLRADITHVTSSHAGLYRQMNEQAEKLAAVSADVAAMRLAVESTEGRLARMQRRSNTLTNLLIASLIMSFLLLLMVVALLVKH